MKKRILSMLLAIVMVMGLLPTAALAEAAEPMVELRMPPYAEIKKPVKYEIVGVDGHEITAYQWFGVQEDNVAYDIAGATGPEYTPIMQYVVNHVSIGLRITVRRSDGSTYDLSSGIAKLYRPAEISSTYTKVIDDGISVVIRNDIIAEEPKLMAAFYEGNKMLGTAKYEGEVQSMEIVNEENIRGYNVIETEIPENATHAKIFLLGDNYEPLCSELDMGLTFALAPKMLAPNAAAKNPYMADSIQNGLYSADVTAAVLPLGIFDEMNETKGTMVPSSALFDSKQNMIVPLDCGVSIVDMSGDTITYEGKFIPANYSVQFSYSFVDSADHIVMPTSHGHIIMVETMDGNGNVLPTFNKIFDLDLSAIAGIDTNLGSIAYDYDGNLWFVACGSGSSQPGVVGYVARDYIDAVLNGKAPDASDYVSMQELDGESAENGISSCKNGVVILTSRNCYMLEADNGITVKWSVDYDSNGSGTTPMLTNDLVLFTDSSAKLIAVSQATGKIVVKTPVLDELPEGTPVSVDNDILVYSAGNGTTSVLVCNGLGAGVERVDIVQNGDEYTANQKWQRNDIHDTSMIKLSTATGYLYGCRQNSAGMWCYTLLDFDTGETALEVPVSDDMAAGMIADVKGNALYFPTDDYTMVWQDVFAYLPDGGELSPFAMERYHLIDPQFDDDDLEAASYLMKVDLSDAEPGTLALRVSGLGLYPKDYELYWQDANGVLHPFTDAWTICGVGGVELAPGGRLEENIVHEIRFDFAGNSESVSVILAKVNIDPA